MRYTPWVVSEHVPDFSTLANLVASPRFAGKTGQDLAVALWDLMVDHDLGIFHYCPPAERLWDRDVYDPLKIFNVYGFTICHVHANVMVMLAQAAGFEARIANIRGHEGTEIFYEGAWHYFDADVQMFHRLRPPNENVIASREDLYRDPTLVWDQPNPSRPYIFPDRDPKSWSKLYETPPEYPDLMEERLHSMDYRLRPGEEMTRYHHHLGRWVVFSHYPEMFKRWRSETGPEGPTERYWPRRQWGNGFFRYAPRLSSAYRDVQAGADEVVGLTAGDDGLVCDGGEGIAVFAFESPYIYCGIPDPLGRVPSADGATLAAAFDLPAGADARVEAAAGWSDDWRTIWSADGKTGPVACEADFTELADAQYRVRLRLVLSGAGAVLKSFATRLCFMVSPHSLPALKTAGDNRMTVHGADGFGLRTRAILIEHRTDEPGFTASAFARENLRHDPSDRARLRPIDPARPWRVVYELKAPNGGKMAWMRAYAIVEGRKPDAPDDGIPATIEIADAPDGPWRTVAERPILVEPHGWHFGIFAEGRFGGESQAGYVRFSAARGANGFRVIGHYVPAGAAADEPSPMEIEHAWYEDRPDVGRRLCTFTERVPAGRDEHEYVVRCQYAPHDERITLRVASEPG